MAQTPDLAASASLAEQALENLVNQFARPLDFLRELVQNAIDAGSPRVAVSVGWSPPKPGEADGVVDIVVRDFGEGMDERIIDSQLTRMFSSTKEDDLTKIGKFGIGFTSIFAVRPDAVLLRTGRHGESWELLFHPDRSFDKVRLDEPVAGTTITLFKRMPASERESFVRECKWVLGYWCEHSDTPVTFEDRTDPAPAAAAETADPFAAFAAPTVAVGPETLSGPMALDVPLHHEHERDGVRVIVGYADEPAYGFYNGGLTLLRTRNSDALGTWAERLGHLAFKVKSDHLEHTLTRDNVLQDDNWRHAMGVLEEAAGALREQLVARVEAHEGDADRTRRWLAAECRASRVHQELARFSTRVTVPDHRGAAVPLAQVHDQAEKVGAVLLAPPAADLAAALESEGLHLLADRPSTRDLLAASPRGSTFGFGEGGRPILRADALFVLPQLLDEAVLPSAERDLVRQTQVLLQKAAGGRIRLRVGDFGGSEAGAAEGLALEGPEGGGVFQRPKDTWFRLPAFLRKRCLLVNRHHPAYRAQAVAAAEAPALAAFALAQALLWVEGLEGDRTWDVLLRAGTDAAGVGA